MRVLTHEIASMTRQVGDPYDRTFGGEPLHAGPADPRSAASHDGDFAGEASQSPQGI